MEWLTIAEAAQRYEKSTAAIRRIVDKSLVDTKKDDRGRVLLRSEQLTQHMIALTKSISTNEAKKQLPTNSNDELIAELRRTIEDLRRMLSEEKARSDRIDKRNEQLQGELLQRHKEMQAVLEKQTGVSGWLRGILKD
ncbi:hypothetical protein [Silvanigrella sp.]|jgi:hypothetical protein|uniref:hypothetical protein n=1 Tax=Silvanigrella sp. TaxID=2024976 RepID=UPI0037CC7CFB